LETGIQPISDAAIAVGPVDGVAADRAAQRALHPDAGIRSPALGKLLAGPGNERFHVGHRLRVIHPGQPFPKIGAVFFDQAQDRSPVGGLELPDFDPRRDLFPECHVPAGFCGFRECEMAGTSVVSGFAA